MQKGIDKFPHIVYNDFRQVRATRHTKDNADMAQLVEHILGKDEVIGSNPIISSKHPYFGKGVLLFYDFSEMNMYADLHLHSTASDGSDTPHELAEKAIAAGLSVFALTDHDTTAGISALLDAVAGRAKVITGVEFSCKENGKSTHILGYGFTPNAPAIEKTLLYGQKLRLWNTEMRLDYLEKHHGIRFTDEENKWILTQNSPSRLHVIMLLMRHGYGNSFREAATLYLDGSKPYEKRLTAGDAISAISEAGAIPVWAHPLGGEGDLHTSPEELLPVLLDYGLMGLECYYSRYTDKEAAYLCTLAKKHKLLISGGSDYHGENKSVRLHELSAEGTTIQAEKLTLLHAFESISKEKNQ